jgi:hypothetical protein
MEMLHLHTRVGEEEGQELLEIPLALDGVEVE